MLLQTVLLYMMAALVLPDAVADEATDLDAQYYREARPFFFTALLMLATSIGKDWMLEGELPEAESLGFHAFFAVVALVAVLSRRRAVHETIAPLMVLFACSCIGLLFARL